VYYEAIVNNVGKLSSCAILCVTVKVIVKIKVKESITLGQTVRSRRGVEI